MSVAHARQPDYASAARRGAQGLWPYEPDRNSRRLETWHKVLIGVGIGVGVGALVGGILLWARPARAASLGIDEDAAVAQSLAELGAEAKTVDLAVHAYSLAYPGAPLPPTGEHVARWDRIVSKLQAELRRIDEQKPVAPSAPVDMDDSSERVQAWVGSLSADQQRKAREIIGSHLWDPTIAAARSGNDVGTKSALRQVKQAIENQISTSKFAALSTYANLRSTLGDDKLNEFMEIMDDTVGLPAMNPAPNPTSGTFWGLWRPTGVSARRRAQPRQ